MKDLLPEAAGRLVYDPRGSRPGTLILELSGDWLRYAQWQIRGVSPRRWAKVQDPDFNLGGNTRHAPKLGLVGELLRPSWGCHITLIRGENIRDHRGDWQRWGRGEDIYFEFDPDPWYNERHLWYGVECGYFAAIREHYGLGRFRGQPHVSAGVWDDKVPAIGIDRRKFR